MEAERSQKHRCKHCSKCFPSGRSLGGHMRCHVTAPAPAPASATTAASTPAATPASSPSEPDDKPQSSRSFVGFSSAYGLRENPKKTWRLSGGSGDEGPTHGDKSCRECGKRFSSWKSLFGHMRSHSLKPSTTIEPEEEQSKTEEDEDEGSRTRSDAGFGNVHVPRKRRRSRRAIAASAAAAAAGISSSSVSASEHEKADVEGAITLMMLSRDVRCWNGGGGVAESSDKNSVVVENKRVCEGDELDLVSGESEEIIKAKKIRRSQLGNLRGGYWSGGIKKVESDASDNGLIGGRGFEHLHDDSKAGFFHIHKDPSSNSASEFGIRREGSELETSLHDASAGDFDANSAEKRRLRRRSRSFECADCSKSFHSYQALGGHRASHHKRIDQNTHLKSGRGGSEKKPRDHECPVCGRTFASGQALGGHKKSHLGFIQQQKLLLPEKTDEQLDLNIPASTTDGDCVSTTNGIDSELNSWWIGGSTVQHEPLVGVISN